MGCEHPCSLNDSCGFCLRYADGGFPQKLKCVENERKDHKIHCPTTIGTLGECNGCSSMRHGHGPTLHSNYRFTEAHASKKEQNIDIRSYVEAVNSSLHVSLSKIRFFLCIFT